MANELVKASSGVPVTGKAMLPVLVERAGGAARYPWLPTGSGEDDSAARFGLTRPRDIIPYTEQLRTHRHRQRDFSFANLADRGENVPSP